MLVTMHDVTNLDLDTCNRLLDEANWDLQLAISNHFHQQSGEAPLSGLRRRLHHQEGQTLNAELSNQATTTNSRLMAITFIPRYLSYQCSIMFRLLSEWYEQCHDSQSLQSWWSMSYITYRTVRFFVESFRIIGRFLWSFAFSEEEVINRRVSVSFDNELIPYGNAEDDVFEFIATFNRQYGPAIPNFYHASLKRAKQTCSHEVRYLLLYIHDPNSVECDQLCRDVLCASNVISFLEQNFVTWACSCTAYESVQVLRSENARRCPFIAVYLPQNGQLSICGRIPNVSDPEMFISRLQDIKEITRSIFEEENARRSHLAESLRLRLEQDANYLRSLEADQEKARQKQVEQEIVEKECQQAALAAQEFVLLQQNARADLNQIEEPSQSNHDVITLSLRLPTGSCLRRRFLICDTVKTLYIYMRAHQEVPMNFHLYTNFPKVLVLEVKKKSLSCDESAQLATVGLASSQSLLVQDLDA